MNVNEPAPIINLRPIARNPDQGFTVVSLFDEEDYRFKDWLYAGLSDLSPSRDRPDGRWRLTARLVAGTTDVEHDSAYAFQLPLIGVTFEGVGGRNTVRVIGWIAPDCRGDDFHVPLPGYDPCKDPKAFRCRAKDCLKVNPEGHMIVPHFVPPFVPGLYEKVRGRRVEIHIGAMYPEFKEPR